MVYARPWVPPSVVSRLYVAGTRNYLEDVHGPHLKSLLLYNFVTTRRLEVEETWAQTMQAWNEWVKTSGRERRTYRWLSNFHRDYHRVRRTLEADSRSLESASRSALTRKPKKNSAFP